MTNRALTNCTRMTDLPFLRINLQISISRMTLLSCHTHQVHKNLSNIRFKYFFQKSLFVSGTTGLPKGVMLSHENLIANICQMVQPKSLEFIEPASDNFQPKTVAVLPLFHAFGLLVTSLPGLHVGGKIVLMPFEPKSFVSAMERTKVR